ncbi:hypothetical protein CEXT_466881 [Caerostris extrusa]|uniref:Uncharacterized protein n=1 Tax=Caerostris extrusa TaxID=172846 RepID=A0AAV4RTX2_CAEEX|nr:hypothetical protein CEXT_466881 [Caerostris extrusa]
MHETRILIRLPNVIQLFQDPKQRVVCGLRGVCEIATCLPRNDLLSKGSVNEVRLCDIGVVAASPPSLKIRPRLKKEFRTLGFVCATLEWLLQRTKSQRRPRLKEFRALGMSSEWGGYFGVINARDGGVFRDLIWYR